MLGVNHLCGFGAHKDFGPIQYIDTFTDTAGTLLTAHTSDSGHTYSKLNGESGNMQISASGTKLVISSTATSALHAINGVTLDSGKTLKATYSITAGTFREMYTLFGGTNLIANNSSTYYYTFWVNVPSSQVSLYKTVAGAASLVATYGITNQNDNIYELTRTGDSYSLVLNGVSIFTRNAVTDGVGTGGELGFMLYVSSGGTIELDTLEII